MSLIDNEKILSEQETIERLQEAGIQVIMKPVALLPDNLENYHGIGRPPFGVIETDIYTALKRLEIRRKVIGDPFS